MDIKEIKDAEVKKIFKVRDKEVHISLQNGKTGVVNGERVILDEILVQNMMKKMIEAIKENQSKYNEIPSEIIIRTDSYNHQKEKEPEISVVEAYEPRYTIEKIALNNSVKEQIETAISAIKYKDKMTNEWGMADYFMGGRAIILNFYGKPGTGKTMTAEAVAQRLGKKVHRINYAELESKYVGETPKNIRRAFTCAEENDAVLVFDEADSFLGKRLSSVTQSADYGVNITRSVLLMELEKFSGVVVFTTNLIENYDEAFKRRIMLSVHFEMPDVTTRERIWQLHLNEKIPLSKDVTAKEVANKYDGISGADIKDIIFHAALYVLRNEKACIDFEALEYAYKIVTERYVNKDKAENLYVVSKERISEEQYLQEVRA